MRLVKLNRENKKKTISETIKVLKNGGLVVFPSDTVYGLLVDATNEKAVEKLIEFKERPAGKPISVFVTNIQMIVTLCKLRNPQKNILDNILPGPFTVVLDFNKKQSTYKISNKLLSEKKTLGIRFPDYDLICELVKLLKKPVTATSANFSGLKPVYSIASLLKQSSKKRKSLLDLVIDADNLPYNKPSTVIDLTSEKIKQLRKGDLAFFENGNFISHSEKETRDYAKKVLIENLNIAEYKPLVFVLKGQLGVGKTVFAKGLGDCLNIKNIISPSFVIYYEYDIQTKKSKIKGQKFVHGDLYNVNDDEELRNVDFERYLKKGNIICIEWGEKSESLIKNATEKAKVLYVDMSYETIKNRKIIVNSVGKDK